MAVTPFDLPYPKTPCCTQTSRLCVWVNGSYCQSKFQIAGIGIFDILAPVTLTLARWPWYTMSARRPWRYAACANMNFLRQGFQKLLSDKHKYIHTDRQTDTTKTITHAASRVVIKLFAKLKWQLRYTPCLSEYEWIKHGHAYGWTSGLQWPGC